MINALSAEKKRFGGAPERFYEVEMILDQRRIQGKVPIKYI
jgi:hypothetical protein